MNTDFMVFDDVIREKQYEKNITSQGDTKHYSDKCKTIRKYAKEQNTIYNPLTNQMLYGLNSNMHVSGVSDGTCNQINPLLFSPNYICGAGAAGGNRCVKDAYPQAYQIETFDSNCVPCNITEFAIFLIVVLIFIGVLYHKNNPESF